MELMLTRKTITDSQIRFNTKVRVSIITPCFNHGKYISEMLSSVFEQTFQDFEVIIVNDGSTDDSYSILNEISDKRVRIFHTKNHGPAWARNLAISKAHGEIILNLDADDKIAPSMLEKCVAIFDSCPNAGIVYTDVEFFGEKKEPFVLPDYSLESMLRANCIVSIACFRQSDWKKTKGYSSEMTHGYEDFDFWLSIIELGREVYTIKEPLVFYRTYKNPDESRSGRRKKDPKKVQEAIVQAFRLHKKLYRQFPNLFDEYSRLEAEIYPASSGWPLFDPILKLLQRMFLKDLFKTQK